MLQKVLKNQFIKDLKLAQKRGKDLEILNKLMDMLLEEKPLPPKNRNHKLKGQYIGCWECHIEPDWLLVYEKTSEEIIFIRSGSHSDLFK